MFLLLFCKQHSSKSCTSFYHPESISRAYLEFQRRDACGICFSQVFQKACMPIDLYISCRSKSIILNCIRMEQTDIHCMSCNNTKILLCFRPCMKAFSQLLLFLCLLPYAS